MNTKEQILLECEKFMDDNNIGYWRYEENGVCCGIEIEQWTDAGVDMIHFLDGRDKDMEDPNWWKEELSDIYNNFDVDDEIDLHRQAEDYRSAFSIRQSLKDFDDYECWLEDIVIKANAA